MAENTSAAGAANFFAAPGTGAVTLTLGGADGTRFAITAGGTLTFNDAPNFEMPRGMALSGSNTNDYALTVTAMNSVDSVASGAITVRVTDVNEAPVLPAITPPAFTEYTAGSFDITATDVDAGQTLTYALNAPNHGATLTTTGTFTWTPGEDDGTVARTFSVTVTDSATPPMMTTGTFDITAMELANRAPTGATITVAAGATSVTNPNTLGLSASATDPDTGDMLTYTWSSSATGDSFSPATGAGTTWTPPTVTAATVVTLTVTITDSTDGRVTATQNVTVNTRPVAPVFTNMGMFTTAIEAAENQSAAGAANFFAAPGTGAVTLTLGGADATRFAITSGGTLTFNDAPNFEMPRGMALSGSNTNDYALTVTAMNSIGSVASGAITVRVTDENEAPVLSTITPPTFTEYSTGTITLAATDVDAGQTLTYALNAPTHGATITTGGTFTWTPGEDDGTVARTFSVTVTDSATPPMMTTGTFDITAMELPNRAPTGATITAAATLTYPDTITLEATAMDADTGTTLTYAWSLPAIADGSVSPVNAATATYTPPTLATGDTARMIVITVTVSDDATPPLTATATHTVTVNPPVPTGTAPVFTNSAMFTSAIEAAENQSAAGVANFFASPGTAPVTLTLGGADATRFAITSGGTLTFADAPNFEMPRGMAFDASSNTNNYALTVTAMNAFGSAMSGAITVRVTDENESPVLPAITPPTFTEYTAGTFDITATDEDAGQTVSFTLNAPNHGATLSSTGTFTWTPGEDDGTVARTFSVTVTDSATTPMMTTGTFDITAMELANRAPTGATLTVAGSATSVTNPNTLGLSASATDPDTGDMLTYTWSSSATGDSFSPATGASTSWTPPTVTAATVVTLTVTITDSTDGSVTATQNVTVNPMVTAPTFTNTFTTPVTAAENQTAAGAANFFAATATGGPVSYALTGADMAFFTLSSTGTLTFNDAPDFERPRGNPLTAGNTNNYALNIAATANGLTTNSPAFTVRVTDVNEAPTITSPAAGAFTASTFTEYSAGTFNVVAADVDDGQTLTYALTAGAAFGAAINADSGAFTWTPREVDGGEERMFTIMVTDSGSPPMTATVTFSITPMELANRAPTGLTITAPTPVTNPATPTVAASATDPDTDMLTYTWSSSAGGDTFNPTTGASVTWTPATVMTATTVTLTVVVTDGEGGSVTSTQDVLVNPAATIPVFANPDDVAFMVVEGTTMAGAANQFSATGTGVVTLTLGGTDAGLFTLTSGGTLTFNDAPDFEMPRGMAFDAGSNTNSYPLTVTATASGLTGSMSFTVTVTDENEAPVLAAIVPAAFTEYSPGTFAITATDVDAGQTLSYALTGATHGATLTTGGTFTWTPGEDDGGMARTFSVTVTDTGTPPMMATGTFDITAAELANRAPTGATITAATMLTSPNPITLMASAMDADTGTTLTYAWAVTTTEGGTIAPVMGASVDLYAADPGDRRHRPHDCHYAHRERRRHHAADRHGHAHGHGESAGGRRYRPGLHQHGDVHNGH